MKKLSLLFLLTFSILFYACSNDDDVKISDANLSGTVEGVDFSFSDGFCFTSDNSVDNKTYLDIFLANAEISCSKFYDYEFARVHVFGEIPVAVGTYTSGFTVAFGNEGVTGINLISGSTLIITEITDTYVTGKLKANSSSNNKVEGSFTVYFCD
ncbi:MAG: hypothetical protein ACK5NB_04420 [Flavobacteriaceae bacterium]